MTDSEQGDHLEKPVEKKVEEPASLQDNAGEKRCTVPPSVRNGSITVFGALKKAVITPQILFLVVGLVFGMLMVFVNPMWHVPDESGHFLKAYVVTEGHFLSVKNNKGVTGDQIPRSIQKTMDILSVEPGKKINEKDVDRAFKVPLRAGSTMWISFQGGYPPVPYLPQGIGIIAGRIFGATPMTLAYLARVGNLFAWLALVFFAIAITPVLKWVMFLLGIMPMSIHLAGSISPDVVTIGVAFLFTAFILRLALAKEKTTVTRRDIGFVFVLGIVLAMCKQPYFFLALLFLMIPTARFKDRKQYYVTLAIFVLVVVSIGLSWTLFEVGCWSVWVSPSISLAKQLSHILHHPVSFGVTVLRTFNVQKEFYLGSFVGAFGWFEVALPAWFPYFFLFGLIAISALDKTDIEIRKRQRVTNVSAIIVIIAAIIAVFYLTYTNVGAGLIQGIQGRYLIPIAPLVFLLFYNHAIKYEKGAWFYVCMVAIAVITVVVTITKIWTHFY